MDGVYVEISIAGSICLDDVESEDVARELVKGAISGEIPDDDIMESIKAMVRNHFESKDIDVGEAFKAY